MDELASYLYDPVKHGVIIAKVRLNIASSLESLRVETEEPTGDTLKTATLGLDKLLRQGRGINSLVSQLNAFTEEGNIRSEYDEKLGGWVDSAISPTGLWYTFDRMFEKETKSSLRYLKGEKPFGPDIIMDKVGDILHITELAVDSQLIVEMTSLTERGVSKYLELFKLLPFEEDQCSVILKPTESHSSRYSYEPFVVAAEMWLQKSSTKMSLPRDLIEYLKASVNYFREEEWRTSITLSAIVVESILAELYEEKFHENAPDIPLGALHDTVKKKLGQENGLLDPVDIHIERANNSRIAAVHRGSRQVSQKESIDALRGAIRVAIWYYLITDVRE